MSVLDMCLELHMSNTGASDPLEKWRRDEFIDFLKWKSRTWKSSIEFTKFFDDVVKRLIEATLIESLKVSQ